MNQPQQRKQKRKTTAETQAKVFWYFYSVSEPLSINRFVFAPKQFKDPLKTLSSKDMLIERVTGIMAKGCQFQQTKKSLQNISAVISLSLVHNVLYNPPTTNSSALQKICLKESILLTSKMLASWRPFPLQVKRYHFTHDALL